MDLSVMYLEEVTNAIITDAYAVKEIKKNIVRINNTYLTQHLQRGDKEISKYFLDMANKFLVEDLDTYVLTKSNTGIYYNQIGHQWNARHCLNGLITLNALKVIDNLEGDNAHLNKGLSSLSDLASNYANLSSTDSCSNLHQDAIVSALQSLALNQLQVIAKKSDDKGKMMSSFDKTELSPTNMELSLSYYNLGVQQEYLKRGSDSEVSFEMSRRFNDNKKGLDFDKKLRTTVSTSCAGRTTGFTKTHRTMMSTASYSLKNIFSLRKQNRIKYIK
jgi:hypothetical protein